MPELVLVAVSTHEGVDGHYVSYLIPAKAAVGMADLPTIDAKGFIAAPQKPGLGYPIDPDKIDELTLKRC